MSTVIGWIGYTLAWALAAAVYALILVAQGYTTLFEGMTSSAVTMGVAAVAGAGVWRLSGRYRLPERRRWRFFVLHVLLGAAYAGFCVIALYAWVWIAAGATMAARVMATAAVWTFALYVLLYAVVAVACYLIRTLRRLRAQQLAAARAEAAAVRAQLVALRSQLNPHFLFNSLHSLSALVRHDADAAERAIEQLGSLLRYALDRGDSDLVYVEDEWSFTRTYLELEQRRLGSRLQVVAELTDAALECMVPPF
ncbi:MAG: sensor histidine kinase, partial [Longimicrobiales bacterium]